MKSAVSFGVETVGAHTATVENAVAVLAVAPTPAMQEIGSRQEDLLAVHRVMQLTADRAGLLLCRDLRSAIRAMFLCQGDYQRELEVAVRFGLGECLSRRDGTGRLILHDLAVRIANLVSFYLSDEYRELDRRVYGETVPT